MNASNRFGGSVMDAYPSWPLYTLVGIVIFAQAALALRLWSWSRLATVAAMVLLSAAGLAVCMAAAENPGWSGRVFAGLAGVHIVYCVTVGWLLGEQRDEKIQTAMAAAYSFGAVGVPVMAMRANIAQWGAGLRRGGAGVRRWAGRHGIPGRQSRRTTG